VGVTVPALRAGSLVAAVALWEAAVRAGLTDPLFVPAPSAVAGALRAGLVTAVPGLAETLGKTIVAYLLSVVLGVGLGLVIGSARHLHDVLSPFVVALYGLPKILVLPWIVLIFGTGAAPAVIYGALHGFFPVLLLVIGGVRDVDPALITVARAFGARPWQLYRRVILPAIVPSALAGMRLGIVFALLGVLIVEMFAGVRGMGFLLGALANGFQAAELFAATLLVSGVSIAIVLALDALGDRLSHWR
jgi:ABC-type nitrate/sulfonate/bicarbonate transport system permease component